MKASIVSSIVSSINRSIVGLAGDNLLFSAPLQTTTILDKGTGSATFTRATTATYTDFENLVKPVLSGEVRFKGSRRIYNLVDMVSGADSEDMTSAGFDVASGVSVTATQATYDGTANGRAQFDITIASDGGGVNSRQFIFSPRIRLISGSISSDASLQIGIIGAGVTNANVAIGDGVDGTDKRFSLLANSAATGGLMRTYVEWDDVGVLEITEWQVEEVTGQTIQTPSEYVSTGVESTPYHGAHVDGVKYFKYANGNTVASNVVTELQGADFDATDDNNDANGPDGYWREEQRINILLHNRTWEDVVWTATNITANDNEVSGVDGRTRAASLTATAGNGTIIQDLGVIGSTANSGSTWIKRKTGSGVVEITLDGGTGWTAVTVTAGWTRVSKTQTLADPDFGIRIVTDTDAIYVDYGQVEASSEARSNTPETAAAAVTVNADALSAPTASNFIDAAGTAFCQAQANDWTTVSGQIIGDGTEAPILSDTTNSGIQSFDGTNTVSGPAGSPSGIESLAATWEATTLTAYSGGVAGTPGTYDEAFSLAQMDIGATTYNGTIRFYQVFSEAKDAAGVGALPQ